jgi:anaerobic selenocysteine-containing dehydrogenase
MRETKSTCPYCGVGCGRAFGGPHGGEVEHLPLVPPPGGGLR